MTRAQTKTDAEAVPQGSEPPGAMGAAPASEPPAPLLVSGATFARYELVRCIGVGGMGTVFEATHTLLRKRVALKALHASLGRSEASRARFLREAETVARVRHPHVVDISDVGVERGVPFLVMEFLEGEDLAALLAREGRLSVERAVDLVLPIVAALSAVHRLGIVHRDIKPENVFLAVNSLGDVQPKLVDFGVSKDLEASATKTAPARHTVAGTPYYMAPEQARGSAVLDGRADQYAVGILLYQCLAGVRPYESESLLELIHMIDAGIYAPLVSHCPELPPELAGVVERAMARRIDDRFASTEAFGQALLPFASEQVRNALAREFFLERRSAPVGSAAVAASGLASRDGSPDQLARLAAETVAAEDVPRGSVAAVTVSVAPRRSVSGVRARDTEPPTARPSLRTRSRRAFVLAFAATFVLLLGVFVALSDRIFPSPEPPVLSEPETPSQLAAPRPAAAVQADEPAEAPLELDAEARGEDPIAPDATAEGNLETPRRPVRPKRSETPSPSASPVDIQLSR